MIHILSVKVLEVLRLVLKWATVAELLRHGDILFSSEITQISMNLHAEDTVKDLTREAWTTEKKPIAVLIHEEGRKSEMLS